MWKLQDFSVNQILREINFVSSGCAKSAILTHSVALNFDIYEFLHFLKAEMYQVAIKLTKFRALKMAGLEILDSPKLISRKI